MTIQAVIGKTAATIGSGESEAASSELARAPRELSWTGPFLELSESTTEDLSFAGLLALLGGAAALADVRLGYGPAAGLPALREAIGRACGVPPEQVLTTQGAMLGLALLGAELGRDGGDALLVTPCFAPALAVFQNGGTRVRSIALDFDAGYRLDPAAVIAALRPATRLVMLATPQNPSGVAIPEATLRTILAAMAERAPDAVLLVDETYREACYDDHACPSSAVLDPRVITFGSLSKAHGVPGLRIGWLTVPDPSLRDRLIRAKAELVICGSVLDEAIAARLLEGGAPMLAQRRQQTARGLAMVEAWRLAEAGRLDWVRPDAGALCCLRLAEAVFDEAAVTRFWAALPRAGVRLAPGTWFGETARVFRLGFGHLPPAELAAGLRAVSRVLDAASEMQRVRPLTRSNVLPDRSTLPMR